MPSDLYYRSKIPTISVDGMHRRIVASRRGPFHHRTAILYLVHGRESYDLSVRKLERRKNWTAAAPGTASCNSFHPVIKTTKRSKLSVV